MKKVLNLIMVIVNEVFLFFLLSIELSNWRVDNSFWAQKKTSSPNQLSHATESACFLQAVVFQIGAFPMRIASSATDLLFEIKEDL
jgi:hypothetical protein